MGEGDLGILYALLVLSPYIAVGLFCLVGFALLLRRQRASKISGAIMLCLAALGIFGLPLVNSMQQSQATEGYLANAILPDAIEMKDAIVLVIGSQSPDCALLCDRLLEDGHAARIVEVRIGQGPSEEIYRKGPFNLTDLKGNVRTRQGRTFSIESVGESIDFVLFNETHWLEYHDPGSFLKFPDDAYSGVFLFRVVDPETFDVSSAELVLRIYQSEQQSNRFLWFSETTNDRSLPSDAKLAELLGAALTKSATR